MPSSSEAMSKSGSRCTFPSVLLDTASSGVVASGILGGVDVFVVGFKTAFLDIFFKINF